MSVLKSERGMSNVEFIDVARKLEIHTLNTLTKCPSKYRYLYTEKIMSLASDIHTMLIQANNIYPKSKADYDTRRYYTLSAQGLLYSLAAKVGILFDALLDNHKQDTSKWLPHAMEVYGELLTLDMKYVANLIRSDEQRFGSLT